MVASDTRWLEMMAEGKNKEGRGTGYAHQELSLLWFAGSTNDVYDELACGISGDGSKSMLG